MRARKITLTAVDAQEAGRALRLVAAGLRYDEENRRQSLLRVAAWLEVIREEVIGVLYR